MIKIRLKRDKKQSPPGAYGRTVFDKKAGEVVHISYFQYPGMPREEGTVGALLHDGPYEKWSFWTSSDLDFAIIFHLEDVAEVIVNRHTTEDEERTALRDAPFPVVEEE